MKLKLTFPVILLSTLLMSSNVIAICPICIVAVAGGLELSHWLGIDDSITGIWIGALILATAIWFIIWLEKKNIKFKFDRAIIIISFYLISVLPLYFTQLIDFSCNLLWGFDKLLLGIIVGTFVFAAGTLTHGWLKKRHQNKSYFSYQKVIVPLLFLIIFSLIFYYITSC